MNNGKTLQEYKEERTKERLHSNAHLLYKYAENGELQYEGAE